jgi:protein tyrosine phosphatase
MSVHVLTTQYCLSIELKIMNGQITKLLLSQHSFWLFMTCIDISNVRYADSASPKAVVAVHCNHGKGRTGTSIISLFLLIGYHKSAKESLLFYNSKRFNKCTYGVDQPCQLRYLNYVEQLRKASQI